MSDDKTQDNTGRTILLPPSNDEMSGVRGYPLYFSQYSGMISCTWASISSSRIEVSRPCF